MEGTTTLKIELGIQAQQIASQLMLHNKSIEEAITKGIEDALSELSDEQYFTEFVKEATKDALNVTIKSVVNEWTFKNKMRDVLEHKLGETIEQQAEAFLRNFKLDEEDTDAHK